MAKRGTLSTNPPEKAVTAAKKPTRVIPGVVEGRDVKDIVKDKSIWVYENRYVRREYYKDGTIRNIVRIPCVDEEGGVEDVEYWWSTRPLFLDTAKDPKMEKVKEVEVDGKTVKRKVVDHYEQKEVEDKETGETRVEEVPVYRMVKDAEGNEIPELEDYTPKYKEKKPASIEFGSGDMLLTVTEEKRKSKERIRFNGTTKQRFEWELESSGLEFVLDEESGIIHIEDGFGTRLDAKFPSPRGTDADGKQVMCRWELNGNKLALVALEDLGQPKVVNVRKVKRAKGLDKEPDTRIVYDYEEWLLPFSFE